jgi:hypothetical protein
MCEKPCLPVATYFTFAVPLPSVDAGVTGFLLKANQRVYSFALSVPFFDDGDPRSRDFSPVRH